MKRFIHPILFCFLTAVIPSISFAGPLELYFQKEKAKAQSRLAADNSIREYRFKQYIDHNDKSAGTFWQRYYVDERYGKNKQSTVFFYICGEGSCDKNVLNGAIRAYAQNHKAKLVALEHRYYGQSQPFPTLSADNLRYLNTEAALNDLAHFQRSISDKNDWTGTWIAFGGSYAGSLSAYYRMKFPYLVAGALASSAPVKAKEDFFEYDEYVEEVAGVHCANNMRQVVSELESSLNDPNRIEDMKALFDASEVNDPIDFLYLVADVGAAAIQYGMRDEFCSALDTDPNPLMGYAKFAKSLYKRFGVTAVQITAQGAQNEETQNYTEGVGLRQWYYQSCKEYGYWQTASPDPLKSARSSLINLEYHHQICQRLFGLNDPADTVQFNAQYYVPLLEELVSNIYFTNGEQDPWSKLSIAEKNDNAINGRLAYYLISGAAHCDDLRTPNKLDSASLSKARQKMNGLLALWLG